MPEAQFAQLPVTEEETRFEKIPIEGDVIDKARELIDSAVWARKKFGVDPLEGINRAAPVFYSDFDWRQCDHLAPFSPLHC